MPAPADDPGSPGEPPTGSDTPGNRPIDPRETGGDPPVDAGETGGPGVDAAAAGGPGRDDEDPGRSLWRGLISLAILIALVAGLLLAVPGLHGVADQVAEMKLGWVLAAVALEILSCIGYVIAFLQVFERAPLRFGARVALSELAAGAAVSLGGAGSLAVGAWVLVERGGDPKRVAERSAVLFLLTSAINVITLAVVGLALYAGILPGPQDALLSLLPGAVGVAVLAFFLALPPVTDRLAARRPPGRVRTIFVEISSSIRQTEQVLFKPDWRIIGAIAFLWCDIGVLAACFAAAGPVPPLSTIVLAYQIGYLSNLVPIPGNIGVLDGSLVGMFVLYGTPATLATAATVVYHGIALWIPAMWGTVAFVILRRTRNEPITLRPPREVRRRRRRERREQRELRERIRAGQR
ncbi:MAG TPA: lysylphosphatidylglycerol synthase transmembrane domain-containing protein [Solirubrobacteraceae bacterium]|nr:lysylphosphatidylglycerol synthase transmembrane domain-containing protein [Solirubrobacteraceae bacterium]